MKTYIILQNIASFRIHWSCLADPSAYRLFLITSEKNYAQLRETAQEDYFATVIHTNDFTLAHLTSVIRSLITDYAIADLEDVRIVTHDEYSLNVAAQLRQELGMKGTQPHEIKNFVNKLTMKQAVAVKGITVPRYLPWQPDHYHNDLYLEAIESVLSFPIFAKPVDESGSVGTAKLETHDQLTAWCEAHLQDTNYELDEWIAGELYHCDSLLRDGHVLYTHVCKDIYPCYDYMEGKINGSYTLPRASEEFRQLAQFTEKVHEALTEKPCNGVTHLEVFRKHNGELVFLEIAARAPAALIPFMYEKHIGMNIEEAHFRLSMELMETFQPVSGPYSGYVYFPRRKGKVAELHQVALRSQSSWTWKIQVGDHLEDPDSIREAACTVLLWNENYADLLADLQELDTFRPFSVVSEMASSLV